MSKAQWAEATEALAKAKTVLIVTHVNPDGDAVGSLLGLGNALHGMSKTITFAIDDNAPQNLRFLPGASAIQSELKAGEWDLAIAVDCGDAARTGKVGEYGLAHSAIVMNIDHHSTNTLFGDIQIVIPEAVSAAEIVYRWLEYMGRPINEAVALSLLTGIITDTMGLRTSNVTAHTIQLVQKLMEAGASLTVVTARALDSMSYNTLRLWKYAISSVALEGKVIFAMVTKADLERAGLPEPTDGGLVSLLNQVDEAMVSAVFTEQADHQVKISLRSKPGYDVGVVAQRLGGGGHTQASGATVAGSLDEARRKVLPLLKRAARKGRLEIV